MFSTQTITEIEAVARRAGLEPAALLAIAEVESGGRAFAIVDGHREPLIRFEGHYFDRLVDDGNRAEARAKGLASPKMGAVKNPRGQAARWRLLERACAIDRDAALQSVSWGIGQVMGAHWKALGYASPEDLADEARSGVAGQVLLMLRYLRANGLVPLLQARDWAGFARAYNGPKFRRFAYDARMASAYARHRTGGAPNGTSLRRGNRGDAVLALQEALASAGLNVACDGVFGRATENAVRAFQQAQGLTIDGIAGAETRSALKEFGKRKPPPDDETGIIARLISWLAGFAR